MAISINSVKGRLKNEAKNILYSSQGRNSARKTLNLLRTSEKYSTYLENKNFRRILENIASEDLPYGKYFAKITIHNWENFKNQKFKLFQNGKLVYGNQIEAPAKGFPLEYRNIPVSSLNKNNFRLNINADFDIKIGKGSFTTVQQRNYDDKYEIIQDGDVFYSLRGNTTNPSKILITFPGFGPSTTRISYAISYLKALTEDDLQNTLMICFQDRYLVSGSYMMVDSARRPLYPRVKSVIDHFMRLYSIDDDNMLLFGASKGGSIALHYAQEFPRARLLIAVPQLNLPYYMNKPFFRYNLFEVKAFHEMIQPEQLLRKYLTEGRRIDYFYTNNDELSNHSVIELAHGVKGLTKYRFNGTHGEVAKAALPTMLNIIREFLGQATNKKIICEDALTYKTEDRLYAQVRIQDDIENNNPANWYLEANDGGTILRVAMTNHTYGFVKYTSPSQAIFPSYDPISSFNKIIGSFDTGLTYIGKLPHKLENNSESQEQINRSFSPLCLNTEKNINHYTIVDENSLGRFLYRSEIINPDGVTAEVHVVDDINRSTFVRPSSVQTYPTKFLMVTQSLDSFAYAHLLALRAVIVGKCQKLRIVVHSKKMGSEDLKKLVKTDWIDLQVVVVNPIQDLDYTKRPFSNWIRKRRLNILSSAK